MIHLCVESQKRQQVGRVPIGRLQNPLPEFRSEPERESLQVGPSPLHETVVESKEVLEGQHMHAQTAKVLLGVGLGHDTS